MDTGRPDLDGRDIHITPNGSDLASLQSPALTPNQQQGYFASITEPYLSVTQYSTSALQLTTKTKSQQVVNGSYLGSDGTSFKVFLNMNRINNAYMLVSETYYLLHVAPCPAMQNIFLFKRNYFQVRRLRFSIQPAILYSTSSLRRKFKVFILQYITRRLHGPDIRFGKVPLCVLRFIDDSQGRSHSCQYLSYPPFLVNFTIDPLSE